MPVLHCLIYCWFVVSFEIGKCESYNLVLFQECFSSSGSLAFPYDFRISFSNFAEKPAGNLIGIALNL